MEFVLAVAIFKGKKFNWIANINLTIPRNELLSFPGFATSSYYSSYVIGKPVSITRLFHSLGVDPASGQYIFEDSHGSSTTSPSYPNDANTWVTTLPKFYGGFQNSFQYKRFKLDLLFQFVKQIGVSDFVNNGTSILPGQFLSFLGGGSNQPTSVLNRWQNIGDKQPIAEYSTNPNPNLDNVFTSDYVYRDASFIRLKNLSLSWQVPTKWRQSQVFQNLRLYIQGENLLTLTKYVGLDPENQGIGSLPPLRVLTAGLQVGF